MNKYDKTIYSLSISMLIAGLAILLMWSHSSKLIGLVIVCTSILILYTVNKKNMVSSTSKEMNEKYAILGIILIIIDLTYNIITKGSFRYFDYGVISTGLFIILLNLNIIRFIKIDNKTNSFFTLFIFFTITLTSIFSTGITLINKILTGNKTNPLYDYVTNLTIKSSVFVLKFVKTTSLTENLIDFDGLRVAIAYPCSGVETMVLFLSAIIAYFISIRERRIKKILNYTLFGLIIFYSINILRIILIILAGYYFGSNALLFIHYNIGWILFVIGMGIYWYFLLRDNSKDETNEIDFK